MADDPWHFPRTDLAQRTLLALTLGPSKALTLFAPRRCGKTEFLRQDLMPAAEAHGHIAIYISFWDPLEPLALLVAALERAVATKTLKGRAAKVAARLTPKIKLSASIPGTDAAGEIDLTQLPKEAKPALLAHVDTLLGRLEQKNKKTILLLDEVQELARRPDDRGLVAALRTSLDVRSAGLRTIFTGSSRDGLQAMFASSKAPFFHFGTQIDLESLDDAFVDHLREQARSVTGRTISRAPALAAFHSLARSPFHFRALIEMLVLRPDLEVEAALAAYRARLATEQGFDSRWLALKPMSRAILLSVAQGRSQLFSAEVVDAISAELGRRVATSSLQRAAQRLGEQGYLDRWDSGWRLADEEFGAWLRARAEEESAAAKE